MIGSKYFGPVKDGAGPGTKAPGTAEAKIEAIETNLTLVEEFLDEHLEKADCPMKTAMEINIAAEEIFVNISKYAYGEDTGTASLCFRAEKGDGEGEPDRAIITFIDQGIPYDPLAKEDPDITLSAEERQIGGLGIFMVKEIMDECYYEYKDGSNVLTLVKYI